MEASMESNTTTMESVAAVVVSGSESEVLVDQQWSNGAVGCSFWQDTGEDHSRGSVPEAVPVASNDIGALQTSGNEGTFLCLDCDMPLNIEMKKDHQLVCKSRQQDADKADHHEMVTSTPLARPTLLTCISDQSPIARLTTVNKETCNNTPVARSNLLQTVGEEPCNNTPISRSALLTTVGEQNCSNRSTLLVSEGNAVARGGLLTTVSEANTIARAGLLTEHTVISRADLMGEQTVISRTGLIDEPTISRQGLTIGGAMSRSTLLTSVASVSDDTQLSRPTLITSVADDTQLSRPTLIATMTEDGIVVTTSPNGSIQLMEPVITQEPNLTETYVTTTTTQPVVTKMKQLPAVKVICQPNGKQCKVYTDEVENYKCPICKYTTTTSAKLTSHKCITLVDKLKCTECSYVGESTGSLSRHMVTHRKSRSFTDFTLRCPEKLDKFVEKRRLDTNEEVFGCTECNFTSSLYLSIKHHAQTHSVANPLKCDKCSFSCKLEVNLRNHKLTHEPREVVKRKKKKSGSNILCKVCQYEYVKGENPDEHIDTHLTMDADKLAFRCMVCELTCDTLQSIRDHVRIHMRSWPYHCAECPFKCNRMFEMKVHQKNAHRKKVLACEECDYTCKLSSNMKLHVKTEHPKRSAKRAPIVEPLQMTTRSRKAKMAKLVLNCTKCEFTTATRPQLEEHLKTHKSLTRYECSDCDYTCKLLRNLEHHKLTHEHDSS